MRLSFIFLLLLTFVACTFVACTPSESTAAAGFENTLVTAVPSPIGFAFTPDGRMLIGSKAGTLYVYKEGTLSPALTLQNICNDSERGLLGVAVDPEFTANNFVYLYYTFENGTNCETKQAVTPVNRVSRFVLQGDTIEVSSETVLVDNIPSFAGNHNAGDVAFGKDGFLYISTGDGGCDYTKPTNCAGANAISATNNHLLGKILRVTKDGGIPAGNPFVDSNSARCNEGSTSADKTCQEIYATGLRNPFRIAFDPNSSSTRFYINDVGQDVWEEINVGAPGANYGWNLREGQCANGSSTNCPSPSPALTDPLFVYRHGNNPEPSPFQNCNSVTAGAFVPKGVWSESLDDSYLFADIACGKIVSLNPANEVTLLTGDADGIVHMAFGPFESGQALYYSSLDNDGEIRRIVYKE